MFIIDFDETIFDKNWFVNFFIDIFANTWRNYKMLCENIELSKTVNNWIFDFKRRLNKCWIKEQEFDVIRKNAKYFLYDDFITFCKRNKEKKIVLTYGDKYFQEKKILHSWIRELVDGYIITSNSNKLEELKKIHKKYKQKIIYIDDRIFVSKNDFDFDIEIFKMNRLGAGKIRDFSIF